MAPDKTGCATANGAARLLKHGCTDGTDDTEYLRISGLGRWAMPRNLFGVTAAERSAATGSAERTPARKADIFDAVVVGGLSGQGRPAS